MFPLNFGVRSLKMVTMPKHVAVKEFKNILILNLCICWCYEGFKVSK